MPRMVMTLGLAVTHLGCGRATETASPPSRIVSYSPSLTEIVFALGAGDRVVAVSDHCDYPPGPRGLVDLLAR
jgi:ABC-type hemin transport system substrate-binding protein